MRQELINLYTSMRIAKAKHYIYGDSYFAMMRHLEETMTREEYVEAREQAENYLSLSEEPL